MSKSSATAAPIPDANRPTSTDALAFPRFESQVEIEFSAAAAMMTSVRRDKGVANVHIHSGQITPPRSPHRPGSKQSLSKIGPKWAFCNVGPVAEVMVALPPRTTNMHKGSDAIAAIATVRRFQTTVFPSNPASGAKDKPTTSHIP
jgi:hypothetical protein